MFIELLQQDAICIIRFHGRFASGAQLEYLDDKLEEIRAQPASRVLAEFHQVDSIGSTGLEFIVRVFESVTQRPGGRFLLVGANPRVRRAFDISRLSEIIPMAKDLTAGLETLHAE